MRMKRNNDKRTARWSRQQSSNGQSAENGNHTDELNMDQLQYHLISDSQMTQETNVINGSDGARRK
jgi:hypothetical protein